MSKSLQMGFILIIVTAIWGSNYAIMKLGLLDFPPMVFNTTRLILATLLVWLAVWIFKTYRPMEVRDRLKVIMLGLVGFALPQVGIVMGVSWTSAGNCSIIMALIPVSVLLINRFGGHEKTGPKMVGGVLISLVGVVLIILGSKSGLSISPADLKGVSIMLATQFCCAIFTVYSRPLVEKYPPFQIIAWEISVATLFFLMISIPQLRSMDWQTVTATGWTSIVYSGMLAMALGNMIWGWGIREIGSARIAVFNNATPVFAVSTGWLALGETFGFIQLCGALVIFAGLQLSQQAARDMYHQPVEDIS